MTKTRAYRRAKDRTLGRIDAREYADRRKWLRRFLWRRKYDVLLCLTFLGSFVITFLLLWMKVI